MRQIKNINIVLEDKVIYGNLTIKDNLILKIEEKGHYKKGKDILIPGFVDIHIHGGYSYDAMDGGDAVKNLALNLPKEGTTAFLPTTMTQKHEKVLEALQAINNYSLNQDEHAARVLGVHLEGPYISPNAAGAQNPTYIRKPNIVEFDKWNKNAGNIIKKVTVAPELDEDLKFVKHLKKNNIVASIAHTTANYETTKKAIAAGLSSFTHTYNAMTKLHHRDIGVVGAALLHTDVLSELIFDKIHTSVEAAKLLYKNKGAENIALITDSMRNKGLPDGISELGGLKVIVKGNEARLEDGSLAGSILKMIDGYKNLITALDLSLVEASLSSSLTPAKSLKVDDKIGSIKVGKYADLLILDKDLNLKETIINGKTVYQK